MRTKAEMACQVLYYVSEVAEYFMPRTDTQRTTATAATTDIDTTTPETADTATSWKKMRSDLVDFLFEDWLYNSDHISDSLCGVTGFSAVRTSPLPVPRRGPTAKVLLRLFPAKKIGVANDAPSAPSTKIFTLGPSEIAAAFFTSYFHSEEKGMTRQQKLAHYLILT
ncbi:unnamed protein product [Amoebophrya sp. A25]|nr:unnamed protein product [Amoebophrya sp. A25]|eukprot:GSA25T00006990001.1